MRLCDCNPARLFATAAATLAMLAGPALAEGMKIFPSGSRPSARGAEATFTGSVRVDPQFAEPAQTQLSAGHVTFEPGARSAWHTHPAGQLLIVSSGTGWVQEWNGAKREIKSGDVIWTPAGLKHWHGATATTGVSHFAIHEAIGGKNVEWLEKVSDDQFAN